MKFNYLRTAAEHHLDSVACRRPLPQKKSHGSFLQSFLLLAALLLAGVGVSWGQLLPTTRYSLSDVGTNQFALVNISEGKAIYGSGDQNLAYDVYSTAFTDARTGYCFVLEKPTNGTYNDNDYLLKFLTRTNENYNVFGYGPAYLNTTSYNSTFVMGQSGASYTNGRDMDNGAVWTITQNSDGTYKLQNKATGKYLAGTSTNDTGVNWSLCSLGSGCKVEFSANDGSMGSVTATVNGTSINSGDNVAYGTQVVLTAHPNSGYAFKNWSNGETTPTRTWTVTQSGHPTANFEAGFTVTFGPIVSGRGTVTATANGSTLTSGQSVPNGTEVTFTAAANSGFKTWRWEGDVTGDVYTTETKVTVTKNINVVYNFTQGITLNAYVRNGGGSVVVVNGSNQGNTLTVNPWPGDATFKATPNAGYMLEGWYTDVNCTQSVQAEADKIVIDGNNVIYKSNYLSTDGMTINLWANLVEIPKKTIGKPFCNHAPGHDNGDNYFDIQNLNAGTDVTIAANATSGQDVTVPTTGGNMSFFFDNTYNLSDLSAWTISGNTDLQARINSVEFIGGDDGTTSLANCYTDAGNRGSSNGKTTIDADLQAKLKKVKEIRIHFKSGEQQTYNFTWIRFSFTHADHSARPVLTEGTAEDMRIFAGEDLTLANNAGFWRQYSDNTFANDKIVNTLIPTNEWKSKYVIPASSLTVNTDYYFGVKDDMTCALGYNHHSDLVGVHVKVVEPIKTVDVNGTTRQYDVYAPDGISGTVGVVISLHGASNDWWNGRVDFNSIADAEKTTDKRFVVVYPRGLMRQLRGQERGWESYTENNTEDVDFFKAIVDELKKTYSVDMNRIYLAGFSNGGMMAYKAAHQAGDFFAAFASVGGYPVNESHLFHAGSQPTPFIHIQGKADGIFPDATYPLNVVAHNMMFRNGADFTPAGDGNGVINPHLANVEEDCHNAAEGGAAYYMYKVANMGHTSWYDWTGDGKDDIAETMWKFFNKSNLTNNLDKTLKFRIYDTANFWNVVNDGVTGGVQVGYIGFEKPNGKTVLTYGGLTNKSTSSTTYDKDTNNKNLWHSLQFKGVVGGTPHFLKLNITTTGATATDYFIIKLVKTGETTPVVIRRYQANAGNGVADNDDYFVNFDALNGWNEYKLIVERSREDLDVKVNGVEFHSGSAKENAAFFPTDLNTVLEGMNPIYQPIFGLSYDDVAKEYLPIANIPVPTKKPIGVDDTIEDILKVTKKKENSDETETTTLTSIPLSRTTEDGKLFINIAVSGKETNEQKAFKSKNAYVLGTGYTLDDSKGIALSHNGPAGMPAYVAGSGDFPTKGVIAMKVQGTFDLTFLLYNALGDTPRKLKVYYTNDQLNGELKEWKNWDFTGTRNETNANGKNVLDLPVRMAQLGQDGTCTLFLTYEGDEADDNAWVKGIIAHRPNLDVTIGRTDKRRYKNGSPIDSKNDKLTCFGENKPYQWNFGTSSFSAIDPKTGEEAKKINQFDGRTYIGGLGPNGEELKDHLLVYSDGAGDDKASFDGRPSNGRHKGFEDDLTDNNEHIEFNHPTKYSGTNTQGGKQVGFDGDRRSFYPILSNGLKVNVTGSGWFTIACSAPNGAVNMKVLSSTNGGNAFINLLREFRVEKSDNPKPETDWQTYRVYLKAHKEVGYKDAKGYVTGDSEGFWDGDQELSTLDPEDTQMSLYVVFDKIDGVTYKDGETAADAQLNIHYLQWINEMPADYVFQREENPKLLNSRQSIITEKGTAEAPGLYWQAGTTMTEGKKSFTSKTTSIENNQFDSAYNSADQEATELGQSGDEEVSADLGCEWNVAAKAYTIAHTEVDYKGTKGNPVYSSFTNAYSWEQANTGASDQRLEFAIPMSGSFLRFMPMKNEFISAWVVPEKDKTTKIFVLDETGKPIPFCDGADMQSGNVDKFGDKATAAREHGWIHAASGAITDASGKTIVNSDGSFSADGTTALRIDFATLASKEYFIVSNVGTISLARLQATDNAERAAVEEISTPLTTLTDKADNSVAISKSMEGIGRYVKSVTLNREFKAGYWASLVLPFSMNEKKLEDVFGPGTKCLHFTDVNTETNVTKLTHHYYNMIVAGRPVFICPGLDVKNPEITDVTLQSSTVIPTTTDNGNFMFTGSYNNQQIDNGDLFMSNNNEMMYLQVEAGHATYPGMRSFIKNLKGYNFENGKLPTEIGAKTMFLNFYDMEEEDNNLVTAIGSFGAEEFGDNVVVVTKSTKVFDMSGRAVANGTDIDRLPAGIYIINGKKFINK